MREKIKRMIISCICFMLIAGLPVNSYAATPVISESQANPPDCYYHYDGQIWIYSTSKYQSEVKSAISLLNKKYNIFRYTKAKSKKDVWIYDQSKPPVQTICALTNQFKSTIILYRASMKRLNKTRRILAIAHEICHSAGLAHSGSKSSLMYSYVDLMKAKGLSKADVKALKKARKRATSRNAGRKKLLNALLMFKKNNVTIPFSYNKSIGRGWVIAFPKRGTVYRSSNSKVVSIQSNGIMMVKGRGAVRLTIKNAGKKHIFKFYIY